MFRRLSVALAAGGALLGALVASPGAAISLAASAAPAPAPLIGSLSVKDTANASKWSVQANLQRGNRIYPDRTYTFTAVPAALRGAAWIRDAGDSKTFTRSPLATFTLGASADVYVGVDTRTGRPSWVDASWTDTGTSETGSEHVTYHLFRKGFASGASVALGPIGSHGTHQAMYTIAAVATATPVSDFSVTVQSSGQTVTAGQSATYTIHTAVVSGTPDAITLSADVPPPAGATVSFSPNPVTPGGDSTMTVATAATTPNGMTTITVTGQDSAATHTATTSLTVGPPPPSDFSLGVAPGSQTVTQGQSTTFTVTTAVVSGSPDPITLTADVPPPAGASATFRPNPVTPGSSSTLTVTTSASTGVGTFTVTITGKDSVATHQAGIGLTVSAPGGNPYGDPGLVSMFDGKTLNGWTPSAAGGWTVVSGAIHGTGTAGRGWIYFNHQVGSFRWIFNVRQVAGNHAPTVLIWGSTTPPIHDALAGIQFQPPNGGHWDYRVGHNNGGGSEFTTFPHAKMDIHNWSQCELLANMTTGVARMACCPLAAGAVTCKATEVLDFHDVTAGRVGPLAIQVHNGGIQDEYRQLWEESPVADPAHFITT
jgi:hypothetical protein